MLICKSCEQGSGGHPSHPTPTPPTSRLGAVNRQSALARLRSETFDVLVAGGGPTGLVVALPMNIMMIWGDSGHGSHSMVTGYLLMLLAFTFGVWWGVLPVSGITTPNAVYASYWVYVMDVIRHLLLPTLTLVLVDIAFFVTVARTALIEVMHEDYMLTARGKGLSRRRIVWRHGVRNAMLPVLTASALYISALVGGAIQVEVVYSWPGMGLLMYNSVLARDYPVPS